MTYARVAALASECLLVLRLFLLCTVYWYWSSDSPSVVGVSMSSLDRDWCGDCLSVCLSVVHCSFPRVFESIPQPSDTQLFCHSLYSS